MKSILIIEDDRDIRENLDEFFTLYKYHVIAAKNGSFGLEVLKNHSVDVIICDVQMPGYDGFEVLEKVKNSANAKDIPFIFLTASAQKDQIAKGKTSGADAYVVKPYNSEYLLDLVKTLVKS